MKIWSVMAAPSRQGIEYMTQIVRPGFTVLTFLHTVSSRNQIKRTTSNPPPSPPQIPCNVKCMQRCEDEGVFNTWFGSLLNEWSRAHISVALPVRPPILGFHWLLQITNRFSSSTLWLTGPWNIFPIQMYWNVLICTLSRRLCIYRFCPPPPQPPHYCAIVH